MSPKYKKRAVTSLQVVQIAAASAQCPRTVERAYDGDASDYSIERTSRAARELGLPPPGDEQ